MEKYVSFVKKKSISSHKRVIKVIKFELFKFRLN